MRRSLALMVLAAVAFSPTPAPARTTKAKTITFETTAPCGAACPHWQSVDQSEAFAKACSKEPVTVPGSYDDVKIKVPSRINGRKPYGLIFTLSPQLEYDGFICVVSNPGRTNERYRYGVTSANEVSDNCDALFFGCSEKTHFAVKPRQTIVLRAINWSDGPTCKGTYRWVY